MWTPRPPEPEPPGWWTEIESAEEYETRRWVEGIAADLRAERVERLRASAHEVDMRCAGALARDRWRRIEWRHVQINGRDERMTHVRPYGGYQVDSWGAKPEVEHRGGGWIVDVR